MIDCTVCDQLGAGEGQEAGRSLGHCGGGGDVGPPQPASARARSNAERSGGIGRYFTSNDGAAVSVTVPENFVRSSQVPAMAMYTSVTR